MKKSLLALACGAFTFGAAEFVMMGILTQAAHDMNVSIPTAGNFISAYAIGVCVGTLMLVFGRKAGPKKLIVLFMVIALVGDLLSAVAPSATMLIIGRFVAGLPHGAFFGTATLIAKTIAEPGKAAKAVSMTITGQTVANMLGVPAGTLIAEHLSWRLAFLLLAGVAALTVVLVTVWVPRIEPVEDAGILGQFRFLGHPGPWMVLGAVLAGNTGIFCWWSYVSPWLQKVGGYSSGMVPLLMMLAGFGMVIGGLYGGHFADRWRSAGTAAMGQFISVIGLALVFLVPGSRLDCAIFTFIISFALFFISSPQQLLMAEAGKGGGELIGGATVQIAFNFGNAVGSTVGGAMLNASHMNYHFPALGGLPFAVIAVLLLALYSWKYEQHTSAIDRLEPVEV
ncbi:MFS transporter [Bifidobacterium sp. ESL0704]|uniref:MFS transporter n=1 Tax=Bifidobacterium sp. ESL0704 TaxID=2983219 RepID=UPI0023F89682|nr:MFS transporter [Bifidobacterium sp. ESL0704]WEV52572.1 MFS transporter [Bifidobacterium sp. ESL0704]